MNQDAEQFLLHLEHSGVKGMKWGVRREANRTARRARFAAGKPTQRDKLISDLDLDRTRSERKARVNPLPARGKRVSELSKAQKGLILVGAAASIAAGVVQVERSLRQYGGSMLPLKFQ